MSEENLVGLQIGDLLSVDGLVAVWCTNSQQQTKCLLEEVFPSWNVHYVATWYWIKVYLKLIFCLHKLSHSLGYYKKWISCR